MEVAATLRREAEELEEDIREWGDELLTVQQAVAESTTTVRAVVATNFYNEEA